MTSIVKPRLTLSVSIGSFLRILILSLPSTVYSQTQASPSPSCTVTPTPAASPSPTPTPCAPCSPTPTPYPAVNPTATPISSSFQPLDRPTKLQARIYCPNNDCDTGHPFPSVIVIHGSHFRGGSPFDHGADTASRTLQANGYYVLNVDYDLAPCGRTPTEICHEDSEAAGRPPQQSDDIETHVRALRADTYHCNGRIGVVGGSSGGSYAFWVALNRSVDTGWPYWNSTQDDRVDCAVSLSGAYQLDDRTPETAYIDNGYPDPLPTFIKDNVNYAGTIDLPSQRSVSVVSLVPSFDTAYAKPLFLISTQFDVMPHHQIDDMICALRSITYPASSYKVMNIPNSDEHSFQYWDSWDGIPCSPQHCLKVSDDVVAFLDAHLKN